MWKPEHRRAACRRGLRYPSDLTDVEWALVEPLIPPAKRGGRRREPGQKSVPRPIRPRCLQDFRALATCRLHAIDARGAPGAPGRNGGRASRHRSYGLPRLQSFSSCLIRRSLWEFGAALGCADRRPRSGSRMVHNPGAGNAENDSAENDSAAKDKGE